MVAKEKMQQWEVFSNYSSKKMVNMNTILSPGHVVLGELPTKFLTLSYTMFYLYDLNSPPVVAILTQPHSVTLFTHFSTTHPDILSLATVIPKEL